MIIRFLQLVSLLLCLQIPQLTAAESLASAHPMRSDLFPWSDSTPDSIRAQYITPLQMLDEPPSEWREQLRSIFQPLVKDCKTAKQAAILISQKTRELTGIHYSTERTRACMNPLETLQQKKASCTGLSLFYAAALRSVDIPARIAGVLSWNHVRGNHTWTEVWIDGQWEMLELGESAYNTPWVMDAVGMLNSDSPYQRVLAITGKKRESTSASPHFYLPWSMDNKSIQAEDVSARYQKLARTWYEKNGLAADEQRILIDVIPRSAEVRVIQLVNSQGEVLSSGHLPTPEDDMREMLRLSLPRNADEACSLVFPDGSKMQISPTEAPTQVLRFRTETSEALPEVK